MGGKIKSILKVRRTLRLCINEAEPDSSSSRLRPCMAYATWRYHRQSLDSRQRYLRTSMWARFAGLFRTPSVVKC
jgi:hypothetical protein